MRRKPLSRKSYDRPVAERQTRFTTGRTMREDVTLRRGRFVVGEFDYGVDAPDVTDSIVQDIGPENAKKLARNPRKYAAQFNRMKRDWKAQQLREQRRGGRQ